MEEETITDTDILLEIYKTLVTVKRALIALVVVVSLVAVTGLVEWSRDRSQRNAARQVEELLR